MSSKVIRSVQNLIILCGDCNKEVYWDELDGITPDGILVCKECFKKYKKEKRNETSKKNGRTRRTKRSR